jgi:2-polyprenyl-6-methoxyphenol hydroxylase-like FAD-dependent oxidoreductase
MVSSWSRSGKRFRSQAGSRIIGKLDSGEEISGDLLVGCDGLHSSVRKLYVDPERNEVYSGKAAAYGFIPVNKAGSTDISRADAQPAVEDTTLISSRYGSLLVTFCEPERKVAHVSAVMDLGEETDDSRNGWKARGDDKRKAHADILASFSGGNLNGLGDFLERVDDWALYPVYILPQKGTWSRGRAVLVGDEAHAVRFTLLYAARPRKERSTDTFCSSFALDAATRRKRGHCD